MADIKYLNPVNVACCKPAVPKICPMCDVQAVLPLDQATLRKQPDNTTHVCRPALGGCNRGFGPKEA